MHATIVFRYGIKKEAPACQSPRGWLTTPAPREAWAVASSTVIRAVTLIVVGQGRFSMFRSHLRAHLREHPDLDPAYP